MKWGIPLNRSSFFLLLWLPLPALADTQYDENFARHMREKTVNQTRILGKQVDKQQLLQQLKSHLINCGAQGVQLDYHKKDKPYSGVLLSRTTGTFKASANRPPWSYCVLQRLLNQPRHFLPGRIQWKADESHFELELEITSYTLEKEIPRIPDTPPTKQEWEKIHDAWLEAITVTDEIAAFQKTMQEDIKVLNQPGYLAHSIHYHYPDKFSEQNYKMIPKRVTRHPALPELLSAGNGWELHALDFNAGRLFQFAAKDLTLFDLQHHDTLLGGKLLFGEWKSIKDFLLKLNPSLSQWKLDKEFSGQRRKISLRFYETPAHQLFRMLREVMLVNMVTPPNDTPVTITIREVPADGLVRFLAQQLKLDLQISENTWYMHPLGTRPELPQLPAVKDRCFIELKQVDANLALAFLQRAFGIPIKLSFEKPKSIDLKLYYVQLATIIRSLAMLADSPPIRKPPASTITSPPEEIDLDQLQLVGVITGTNPPMALCHYQQQWFILSKGETLMERTVLLRRDRLALVSDKPGEKKWLEFRLDRNAKSEPSAIGQWRLAAFAHNDRQGHAWFVDHQGVYHTLSTSCPEDAEETCVRILPNNGVEVINRFRNESEWKEQRWTFFITPASACH